MKFLIFLFILMPLTCSQNQNKYPKKTKYSELNPLFNQSKDAKNINTQYSELNPLVNKTIKSGYSSNDRSIRNSESPRPRNQTDIKNNKIYKSIENLRSFKQSNRFAEIRNKQHNNKEKTEQRKPKKKPTKGEEKKSKDKKGPSNRNSTEVNNRKRIKPIVHIYGGNATEIQRDLNAYQGLRDLQELLRVIVTSNFNTNEHKCLAVITDSYYKDAFQKRILISVAKNLSYYMVKVKDYEDLISPSYQTLKSMKQVHKEGCKVYIILLANGFQVARLLKFSDRNRMIDTRANFLMLYDPRLFYPNLHYLWKRIVNVIFIRSYKGPQDQVRQKASFELSTVPFPNPIRGILVPKRVDIWRIGKFKTEINLFADKTVDLKGQELRVVVFQHIPAVIKTHPALQYNLETENGENEKSEKPKNSTSRMYSGLEVETVIALGKAMNFKPILYEVEKSSTEQWGRKQPDGSFDGLLGDIISGKADIGLGDFHYTPYHLDLIDLSLPYNTECLTFLTPEALTDNSWQTLILPFKFYMWIGVIIGLCLGGFIFYGLARFQYFLMSNNKKSNEIVPWNPIQEEIRIDRRENGSTYSTFIVPSMYYPTNHNVQLEPKSEGLYLFGDLFNSFLYTYSMLLVVSLPKLPTGWSLRVLTGWYWLYCILIVVSYRASMTAILANPAPRVTIDTLQELADSTVRCGGWGDQILDFFLTSLDTAGQKVGQKFENVENPDSAVVRIAKGEFAYYENQYFLKAISVKRQIQLASGPEIKNDTYTATLNGQGSDSPLEMNSTEISQNGAEKVENERNLHIMATCVINMPISIGLQKNSPLKPRADEFLRRVIEAGLIEKWLNDVMSTILNAEVVQDEKIKALMNLKKLYGAIVMLLVGYGFSLLVLIFELVYWHCVVTKKPHFDKYSINKFYSRKSRKSLISSSNNSIVLSRSK